RVLSLTEGSSARSGRRTLVRTRAACLGGSFVRAHAARRVDANTLGISPAHGGILDRRGAEAIEISGLFISCKFIRASFGLDWNIESRHAYTIMNFRSSSSRSGLSVIVPVFNSEHSLRLLIERLLPVLQSHGPRFEVILVNDDSRDKSWEVIQKLSRDYSWVRGILLTRNFGQHNALLCGIYTARYSVIVTLDD